METTDKLKWLKKLNLTRRSILIAGALFLIASVWVCLQSGFETKEKKTLSAILESLFALLFIIYCVIVLCLYYRLPKNKNKNKAGVLFIINTHYNEKDYKTIREKFIEHFENIIEDNNSCPIVPIVLSQKQVWGLKNPDNDRKAKKIMLQTNCMVCVYLTTYDIGTKSKKYQLQISARVFYPKMNRVVKEVFTNNLNTIFLGLHINEINREKDLQPLQLLSSKLLCVCQIIVATVNEYLGNYSFAEKVYKQLLHKISVTRDIFFQKIQQILYLELYHCCKLLLIDSYSTYIIKGTYEANKILPILTDLSNLLKVLNSDEALQCYYSYKAIHDVLTGNPYDANKSIEWLKKKYDNIKRNERPWEYSEAFLFACQANVKQFDKIEKKYKVLKNNTSMDIKKIFSFINQYVDQNSENIGVKIALFWLTYYRKDLSMGRLSSKFVNQLVDELRSCQCTNLAEQIFTKYQEYLNVRENR